MKLEKNMYVRTKTGDGAITIAKCIDINNPFSKCYRFDNIVSYNCGYEYDYICKEDLDKKVLKSSFNIIDLIEVGDYVNGKLVIINNTGEEKSLIVCCCGWRDTFKISNENIKLIVTKEEFISLGYRV